MIFSKRGQAVITAGGVLCTLAGVTVIWKDKIGGEKLYDRDNDQRSIKERMKGKVIIVTGSNSGLGEETAYTLAQAGAKVYMACRNMARCESARQNIVLATKNRYVYCRECDLASLKSIRQFVDNFKAQEHHLDVLINNAGVMNCPKSYSKDGIEMHWAVNHLGHFLLTSLLKDYLVQAAPSRIIFLINLDYRKAQLDLKHLHQVEKYNAAQAFEQSQLANMLLVHHLAQELRESGVTVNAAYPGVVRTQIKRHMGVDKSILGNFLSNPLLWFLTSDVMRGSQTTLFLAMDPSVVTTTGKLFSKSKEIDKDPMAEDSTLAKRLVAVDKYWSGLVSSKEELAKEMR
ncbi:retinol dehydrogenase 13-like [Tigriopus californicus]|uniref:retinol dehydrogenase 13-like n=1 Tax=Tigriopus californicus TaxID=6832 RepID=UPI0027DA5C11|nr:retinol dehydrogenase 13-like [Tigriopus californicus]